MHEAEGFLHLLLDWPHWLFEAVSEALFFLLEVFVLAKLLNRHDEKQHQWGRC